MQKILLIARSEYLRRVRTKTFILTTLLAPVLMFAVIALPVAMAVLSEDDSARRIAMVDETGRLAQPLVETLPSSYAISVVNESIDSLRSQVLDGRLDGFFVLPAGLMDGTSGAAYYGRGGGGLSQQMALHGALRDAVRRQRIRDAGAGEEVLALLEERAALDLITVSDEGDAADGAVISSILGYMLGMLIYVSVLIYGVMVMRGVIEEKSTRIVEVIASSARPIQLMMGKVFGIGAVGLTQLIGWSVLMMFVGVLAGPLMAMAFTPEVTTTPGVSMPEGMAAGVPAGELPFDPASLATVLSPGMLASFVGFFLGGYLLFSALFAAVGSAVEQESDAQTLQFPVMVPIIIPLFFLPYIIEKPDAALSVFLSLFPFSSPIMMTVRMAVTSVPAWQVLLAFVFLGLGFMAMIWIAARIYRVGILMYGKKATLSDLWKWARTA